MLKQKKEKDEKKTQSPYILFNNWLFDGDLETPIPEPWVLRALNPCTILQSFSMLNSITVYLDETFNNFNIYQIEKETFFKYLKEFVIRKKISKNHICFFRHHKEDKDITYIHNLIPYIKRYEVFQFLDVIKNDEEFNDRFLITIGLKEEKKSKLTSSEKKEVSERLKKMKEVEQIKNKPVSLDDWEKNFQ